MGLWLTLNRIQREYPCLEIHDYPKLSNKIEANYSVDAMLLTHSVTENFDILYFGSRQTQRFKGYLWDKMSL